MRKFKTDKEKKERIEELSGAIAQVRKDMADKYRDGPMTYNPRYKIADYESEISRLRAELEAGLSI